ncbi:hypothetical protein ACA910_008003 [Epithemia clementina (nom. ined.)]
MVFTAVPSDAFTAAPQSPMVYQQRHFGFGFGFGLVRPKPHPVLRQWMSSGGGGGTPKTDEMESVAASVALGADVVVTKEVGEPQPPPPKVACVQRSYRCYEWRYQGKTYSINYRVEGPDFVVNNDADDDADDGSQRPRRPPQPVLLVHGFGANVNHFRHQFPALRDAGYRVYAIDLIGFGASDKATDVEYSIDLFVDLLHDFVHAMNERYHHSRPPPHVDEHDSKNVSWIVAGNSIGGLCSLGLAKKLPHHVQGVVLLNCAGGMSGFRYDDVPWWVRPILYLVQNVVLKGDWGHRFFQNFKSPDNVERILRNQGVYRNQTHVNDELLELLLGPSEDEGAATVFLKVFGGDPGPTPESILPDVPCPVLALWGETDPWTPHDKGAHPGTGLVQYHHDFHLEVLPDTGHCPHDERPELVHSFMIPWMEQVQQRYQPPPPSKPLPRQPSSQEDNME